MTSPVNLNNISLLRFMRLSREKNLTTEGLDDLVSRLGSSALAELKVLTPLERSRLRFVLCRFEPIVSENSSTWLQEMLTTTQTLEVKGAEWVQKKIDEELKAELEEGLKKWLKKEHSEKRDTAIWRIRDAYDSNATELDLMCLQLTSLPSEIGLLTNLAELNLVLNKVTELPLTFRQLTNLKELYLALNKLTELPLTFRQLTNLKVLDLSNHRFSKLPPILGQLTNLQVLELSNNHLSELQPFLGQLTHLQKLYLRGNKLTELPPTLGQLTNLLLLDLGWNELTELPATLVQLTNLQHLHLRENKLTKLPSSLGQLYQLEGLSIEGNPELSDLPISLGNIPALTYLDTNDTLIPQATREAILAVCKSARERESHKKLPQTFSLWKTTARSQADLNFLTKDPILSSEKLGGLKEVSQPEARGPLKEGSLRVRINGHLYDFTVDEVSELWKIQKGTLLSKLQEGTYLEEGSFSRHQQAILYEWLVRLSQSSDYSRSQKRLAVRVCKILDALKDNLEFRERFFILADANNERCGDRAAMSLNEIYTAYLLTNLPIEASSQDKLKLLVGLAKTYTLRKTLAELMENQSGLEESVEIYLAKETSLKKRLGLVTAIKTMLYEPIGQRGWLNDDDLVKAVNANFFDQLFKFDQLQKLMKEDPDYVAKEESLTSPFERQMEELEKNMGTIPEQDYLEKVENISKQKENVLKELTREWVGRRLHV